MRLAIWLLRIREDLLFSAESDFGLRFGLRAAGEMSQLTWHLAGQIGVVPGQWPGWGCSCRRWARAVWRRPAPRVRMAAARARRDPASTTSFLARVTPV